MRRESKVTFIYIDVSDKVNLYAIDTTLLHFPPRYLGLLLYRIELLFGVFNWLQQLYNRYCTLNEVNCFRLDLSGRANKFAQSPIWMRLPAHRL